MRTPAFSLLSLLLPLVCLPATSQQAVSPAQSRELVGELVAANHILADQAVLDSFGHVSVRDDRDPRRMLLSRSMAPALVTTSDVLEIDIDTCSPIDAQARPSYLERFIHCEIYRRDPNVMSVVHTHAPALIAFGVSQIPLRAVYHMGAFLGDGIPTFEIRKVGGEGTDLLIRNQTLGRALADMLGDYPAVLMRGHGATVVGGSLRQAVFRAVYSMIDARIEADALRLGPVTFLSEDEAKSAAATNDGQIGRAWELWRLEALKGQKVFK